jgi:hypothetical protein
LLSHWPLVDWPYQRHFARSLINFVRKHVVSEKSSLDVQYT